MRLLLLIIFTTFVNPNVAMNNRYFPSHTLHDAVKYGSLKDMHRLIDEGADVNQRNSLQQTPLHIAIANGNVPACKILLEYNAHIFYIDSHGKTPLEIAQINNDKECIDLLTKNDPKK